MSRHPFPIAICYVIESVSKMQIIIKAGRKRKNSIIKSLFMSNIIEVRTEHTVTGNKAT